MDLRWRLRRARKQRRERLFAAELRRNGAKIAPMTFINADCWVAAPLTLEYGARMGRCKLTGGEPVTIGRYAMVGTDVRMHSNNHDYRSVNMMGALQRRLGFAYHMASNGPIRIGHATFIGEATIILSGVTIGDGAVVGAGSVVTRDIPPFAIAVGSPARVIRMRFADEEIKRLQDLAWWNWSEEEMREHPEIFEEPLSVGPPLVATSAGQNGAG